MRRSLARVAPWPAALAVAVAVLLPRPAGADVLVLANGGQIRGTLLNRGQSPRTLYEVRTESGGVVSIRADQVRQAIEEGAAHLEYRRLAPLAPDTPDEQWKLAEWCREHHLGEERAGHLRRILQLDPDHVRARRALGYVPLGDRWITQDEWRKEIGLQFYRGQWRLPQEIEILEEQRKTELARKEWLERMRRWRTLLAGDRAAEARENFLAVRDPLAVPGLAELLKREPYRAAKLLYVEALANVGDGQAADLLVRLTIYDPDIEVRLEALDRVVAMRPPGVVKYYARALEDGNNVVVNRAAVALRELDDPSAIAKLIDALVTVHQLTYTPPGGGSPDSITRTFIHPGGSSSSDSPKALLGGSGLSVGPRTQTVQVRVANEEVLAALVSLARGQSFAFDQQSWQRWHAAQRQAQVIDLRQE